MPEGHTVHRLARAFQQYFAGKRVRASSPQGRFAEGAASLDGHVLNRAEAVGKQMFLYFSGDTGLRVHLGLYGNWRFAGEGLEGIGRRTRNAADGEVPAPFPPEPTGAVRIRLLAARHVADLSGPTSCVIETPAQMAASRALLGADPLREDADPDAAFARLKKSRAAIGLLLMRQDIVAGIGNIYRAELLFRARLDPHSPGTALTRTQWKKMWADLATLMQDGARTGRIVTTEKKHRRKKSGAVSRDDAVYVAHRAGLACHVCGTAVLAAPMGGRTLYWCPLCQAA